MKPEPRQLPIPQRPANLTVEWLAEALGLPVSGFGIEMIGGGKGFTGQVARLTLKYPTDSIGAPATVIAKFPPASAEARATLNFFRIYEKEAAFYREIAGSINFRTPHAYYIDVKPDSGESILLLEDLASARPCDIISGLKREEAEFALLALARFHASWWESPKLAKHTWLNSFDWNSEILQQRYTAIYTAFVENTRGLIPKELIDIGEKLRTKIVSIKHRLSQPPVTFLHGDFHPNNLFMMENPARLAAVDWQVCSRGRAARDLMYFIASALNREDRRAHDIDLIRLYHSELLANGVMQYSLDECIGDFRLSLLDLLYFMVMVVLLLNFNADDESRAVRMRILERWGNAILDHRAGELLP